MPLQQEVYSENLDVTLTINGDEWYLLQCKAELSTADTPDFVDMVITPTESTAAGLPSSPQNKVTNGGLLGTGFELTVETEINASPRTGGGKIFSGFLANLSPSGQGAWEAIAWDPSHQKFASGEGAGNEGNFLNSTIDIQTATNERVFRGPDQAPAIIQYSDDSSNVATATKIRATELVDKIIEESPVPESNARTNFSKDGIEVGTRPDGSSVLAGIDRELYFSGYELKVSDALERIENSTNSTYWFDEDGVFNIGAAEPGNPIDAWDLQFITDTSAGKSTPAWNGVQVIGSGVVSEDGWDRANLNSSRYTRSISSLAEDGKTDTEDLSEPVFTYRNLEIQTQAEANAVAKEIVNKLRDQQAEGKITVTGFPEIRPLDAVQMPNTELQPMGGERYGVVKVVHNINPDDGFITDIHVGGLTREQSTVYNSELTGEIQQNVVTGRSTEGL